jgi:hypothetical protein
MTTTLNNQPQQTNTEPNMIDEFLNLSDEDLQLITLIRV